MTDRRALIIDNRPVGAASGKSTPDINPYTQDAFATVAAASAGDIAAAVSAADDARAEWAATPPSRKRAILWGAADLLESRVEAAVALMTAETGATGGWAGFNVALGAAMLREAAAAVTRPIGEVLATDAPGALSLSVRQPAGVVAAFAPWNAPIILG
ncbi:MAG TPA: aldehyde dehydrogenase family protein, partial [Stackebrandtia sp.]|uniref:aldehyde dehydrogenase family protein n=1 Tax=Stackebrandtia sp. TaxID=2023065 RepID=UPI002D2FF324